MKQGRMLLTGRDPTLSSLLPIPTRRPSYVLEPPKFVDLTGPNSPWYPSNHGGQLLPPAPPRSCRTLSPFPEDE